MNTSLMECNVQELKETEPESIKSVLLTLAPKESIYVIVKTYIQQLSFNYNQTW